jgi:hypothetical protein
MLAWSLRVVGAASSVLILAGCGTDVRVPDGTTSVTNTSSQTIRLTGNCVPDHAQTLGPGETDSDLYAGADCRVDNGDGQAGVLGCLTLTAQHTDLTLSALRPISGPDDCWESGSR